MVGNNSIGFANNRKKDILSVALYPNGSEVPGFGAQDLADRCKDRLRQLMHGEKAGEPTKVFRTEEDDPIALTISQDFIEVCKLESYMPRLHWVEILMAFLRISLPAWLLSQSRLTLMVRDWVISALDGKPAMNSSEIAMQIAGRGKGLLYPTTTPTRQVFEHIESYMHARVELSLLANQLLGLAPDALEGRVLVPEGAGEGKIDIPELLALFTQKRRELIVQDGGTARSWISRLAEDYSAWKNPLGAGQGKNIAEFLRVLERGREGDEAGSYLLSRHGRGPQTAFTTLPGPTLLRTYGFLAECRKARELGTIAKGKLVVADLEEHLGLYGIAFSATASARPQLLRVLMECGMLRGSPDAGDSAELSLPFGAAPARPKPGPPKKSGDVTQL